MTDEFNPERLNAAMREVKKLTGIDMRPKSEYDERVEARAAKLLHDHVFVCEAFSEMDEEWIRIIGQWSSMEHISTGMAMELGYKLRAGIREYALAVAKKELG